MPQVPLRRLRHGAAHLRPGALEREEFDGPACVAVSQKWIWDPDETLFALPRDRSCSAHHISWKGKHGPRGWGVDKRLRRAATTQYLFAHMNSTIYESAAGTAAYRAFEKAKEAKRRVVSVHVRWGDKGREMTLRPIEDYVEAVRNVTTEDASSTSF